MLESKRVETPMNANVQVDYDFPIVDKGIYQGLVGKLIYLAHMRPDIGFAVRVDSQFMSKPAKDHMDDINRILRYLKRNPGKGLFFKKSSTRDIIV